MQTDPEDGSEMQCEPGNDEATVEEAACEEEIPLSNTVNKKCNSAVKTDWRLCAESEIDRLMGEQWATQNEYKCELCLAPFDALDVLQGHITAEHQMTVSSYEEVHGKIFRQVNHV